MALLNDQDRVALENLAGWLSDLTEKQARRVHEVAEMARTIRKELLEQEEKRLKGWPENSQAASASGL
jgi:hypothetical protein